MSFVYDNSFGPNNVYGHALHLLRKLVKPNDDGIHLDVGCGFGTIASHVTAMGLHYVGVDVDPDGLNRLKEQGYEAHRIELRPDATATYDALTAIIGGRKVASITVLDTLEHVISPLEVMRALRRIATLSNAPIVISVPNITHTEIAARLVTGRFDYTVDGVLDHTHIIHFSPQTLKRMSTQVGLFEVASFDTTVVHPSRDMHLDVDAPSHRSSYYQLISHIGGNAHQAYNSYQLVRAFLPGPPHDEDSWYKSFDDQPVRPFLTIVVRTVGTELHALRDTLLCLSGQSDLDFEVLLIGHNLDKIRQIDVEKVIEDQPIYMRSRINFVRTNEGGRARPLNVGYKLAAGRYIVTLDDDDFVFGNYVEVFRTLHDKQPGRLLRARCASQNSRKSFVEGGRAAAISSSPIEPKYPAHFSLLDHLSDNYTPCMSIAYPREIVNIFGLEFDEKLSTAEDWDFMMRSYFIVGIATSAEITSIYRRWSDKVTSAQVHSQDEWLRNRTVIMQKHDALPVILSAGDLRQIRNLYDAALDHGVPIPVPPVQHAEGSVAPPAPVAFSTRLKRKMRRKIAQYLKFIR